MPLDIKKSTKRLPISKLNLNWFIEIKNWHIGSNQFFVPVADATHKLSQIICFSFTLTQRKRCSV